MKLNKTLLIGLVFSASLLAGIYGCSSNDSEMKSVDLRYKVDDSYLVEASEPELITFTVKSSDPWSVFGTDEEWYEISPNEGQADSIYTVKLQCKENTDLDDRSDTITIKSDYWVGKQFQVTQKGTAFISIGGSNFELPQETSEDTFTIHSNQKWSAKVTAGEDWLTITSADNGEKDGTLTVQAILNKGEKRTGEVTIYDRYETPYLIATYTQDGVMLNPAAPENGKWYALYSEAQSIVIPVESNGDWIVSKENEEDDDWFSFENTSFSG
ncbi:MAG: BACON domain-containing protein, partial [Bacteroides sp.]